MQRSTRAIASVAAVLVLAFPVAGAGATDTPTFPEIPVVFEPVNISVSTVAVDTQTVTPVVKKKKKKPSRAARGFKYVRATGGSVSASFGDRSRYWSVRHTGIDYNLSLIHISEPTRL
ncbi:MAG: hypothetical protein RLZZ426_183, partial [Actinomycetota bacterium]